MAPGVGVEGRDAHQPVHAGLGLKPAVGVGPLHLQGGGLDARLFSAGLFDNVDAHAVRVGPAAVHAFEHLGPVLGLGAAGAGVDLHKAVVAVGLAGQQRLQLGPRRHLLEPRQLPAGLFKRSLVALRVGQLGITQRVRQGVLDLAHGINLGSQAIAVAHERLGFPGPVPKAGLFRSGVQLVQAAKGRFPVKDAS